MRPIDRRQPFRSLFFGIVGIGILGVGVTAFVNREAIVDAWYIHQLDSGSLDERRAALARLRDRRSSRAIPRLLDIIAQESPRSPLAVDGELGCGTSSISIVSWPEECYGAIREMGENAEPALVRALSHQRPVIRAWACQLLVYPEAGARRHIGRLATLLADPSRIVRHTAAWALSQAGWVVPGAYDIVVRELCTENAGHASRQAAALALGEMISLASEVLPEHDDFESLVAEFETTPQDLEAVRARVSNATSVLRNAAHDPSPTVRKAALWALIHNVDLPSRRELLLKALDDPDAGVADRALFILGNYDWDEYVAEPARPVIDAVSRLLTHRDSQVRLHAQQLLQEQASPSGVRAAWAVRR